MPSGITDRSQFENKTKEHRRKQQMKIPTGPLSVCWSRFSLTNIHSEKPEGFAVAGHLTVWQAGTLCKQRHTNLMFIFENETQKHPSEL